MLRTLGLIAMGVAGNTLTGVFIRWMRAGSPRWGLNSMTWKPFWKSIKSQNLNRSKHFSSSVELICCGCLSASPNLVAVGSNIVLICDECVLSKLTSMVEPLDSGLFLFSISFDGFLFCEPGSFMDVQVLVRQMIMVFHKAESAQATNIQRGKSRY